MKPDPSLCVAIFLLLLCCSPGCGGSDTFTPGLGEIMTLEQMRHGKLWFAGQAGNWDLAAYEVDELEEGFSDAMRFHPTHKSSPEPLTQAIPAYTEAPVKELREAIEAEDPERFEHAFDALTAACNGCHVATTFAYNVVVRPRANTFANQDFAAPKH